MAQVASQPARYDQVSYNESNALDPMNDADEDYGFFEESLLPITATSAWMSCLDFCLALRTV